MQMQTQPESTVNCAALATANAFAVVVVLFAFVPGSARDMFAFASGSLQLFVFVCLSPSRRRTPQHSYSPFALSNTLPNHDKIPIKVAFKYL